MEATDNLPVDGVTAPEPAEDTTTYTATDMKKAQQATSRWQKRASASEAREAERATSADSRTARVEKMLDDFLGVVANSDAFEAQKPAIEQIRTGLVDDRKSADAEARFIGELTTVLGDYDGDWNADPQYADARAAAKSGNFEEALRLSRQTESQDIDALIETKVQEKLKDLGRVDIDRPSAPTPKTASLDDLNKMNVNHMTPAQLVVHKEDLYKAMETQDKTIYRR